MRNSVIKHVFVLLALASGFMALASEDARAANYSFVYVSDVQGLTPTATQVRDSVIRSGMKNLVMAGDQNGDPRIGWPDIWAPWLKAGMFFDVVALGNHRNGTYEDEMRYFGLPAEFYAVVRGDVRFIVLNSDNVATADKQAQWFADQLQSAREKMVLVMFHHSPYTISAKHKWEERAEFHLRIRPLLERYKDRIAALFVGHDHFQAIYQMGGIPVVISSATGYPKVDRPYRYREGNVDIVPWWLYKGGIGWARVDVNTQTGDILVNFIDGEKDQVRCTANVGQHAIRVAENCRLSAASFR